MRASKRLRILTVLLAGVACVVAIGCSLETLKSPFRGGMLKFKDATAPGGAAMTSASSPIGKELAEFTPFSFDINTLNVDGQPLRLTDYRGKIVIVDLWGTWCGPCRKAIPHLVKLQAQHPTDLQIVGLCNERTPDVRAAASQLNAAIEEYGINYPCALIDDNTIRKIPNFSGYPTMLFIDRVGTVRMMTVGVKPDGYWESLLAALMTESTQTSEPIARTAAPILR